MGKSPTKSKENLVVEKLYRMVYDPKTQMLTDKGSVLLENTNIDPESLIMRSLEDFREECRDKDIAKLHYEHHMKRR